MAQFTSFAAARSSIVSDCLGEQPYVTDADADAFASTAAFADWCMEGSAGDDTRAALRDLGMPDLDGDLFRSVRDAIEAAADIKGLAWINEGLIPRSDEDTAGPADGLYDDAACTVRLDDDSELPSIFYHRSAGTVTRYWYTQPHSYDTHELRVRGGEVIWLGCGGVTIDDDTTVEEFLQTEAA